MNDEESDYVYCKPGPSVNELISLTHVANYIKDLTILILSAFRILYFVYVLLRVCRESAKPFCKRPAFMNLLPILILLTSVTDLFSGVFILTGTV